MSEEEKDLINLKISISPEKYIKELLKENQVLKKDIKNIIRILNKNCDDLEATEEEFESLEKWDK